MKKRFGLVIFTALLLTACGNGDSGVPDVKDPNKPTDEKGNVITSTEFLNRYCVGKKEVNETCQKVVHAARRNASQGKMPEGW